MNIVVLLRALRDPAGFTVNRKAQKIFYNRDLYQLNPADHCALEAGLRLADHGHHLAAIAYGGPPAQDVLYDARAKGAHRALWVDDAALTEADGAVIARVAAGALNHLGGADLALLGADVLDADLAQVGPRLAAALGWALVEAAWEVTANAEGRLRAVVAGAGGYRALEASLPAVISVAADSHAPRYAPAPSIIRVYQELAAVERLAPESLALDTAALAPRVTRRGESFPPERTLGRRLEGDAAAQAAEVAELLRTRR
jgi:electron transfer flavoprotein beta subunit